MKGRLTLITSREIAEGEELIYNHGTEYSWEDGELKSLTRSNKRTSTQLPAGPETRNEPKLRSNDPRLQDNESKDSGPPMSRRTGQLMQRYLPTSFVLGDLEDDSCIVYEDNKSGDEPEG